MTARPRLLLLSFALSAFACSAPRPEAPDAGTQEDAGVEVADPEVLSDTGLYSDFGTRTLAPGVFPFTPRFELWSDGAEKQRYLLLPPGTKIDTSDMDAWAFPVGTKAWKEFTRDGKLVETRLLWKRNDGWFQMAYAWNAEGTEAFAAPDGVVDANGTAHDVPSQAGCEPCHAGVRDVLIGPDAVQLSSADGNGQLTSWAQVGRLSHPPASEFDVPGTGQVEFALGYLHANCGHCHREGNALASKRGLRLEVRTTDSQPELSGAYTSTRNVSAYHVFEGTTQLVVPGDPDSSQLYRRLLIRDAESVNEAYGYQMPPLCTEVTDDQSNAVIRAWIEQQ